ncbi:MAG: aminoacyl-tRNA hydrolase [Rickettsiales bacterium]|jgi:PTH1 family peptidyl-tRNA hydrolase|nr:aminoacyl-tRNA hydrolase [Rickettsiales bacterium]
MAKLVIGLGNPGAKYAHTRHNVGFMVIDALAEALNAPGFKEKPKYLYTKVGDFILAKPTTFMNLSGEAAATLANMYKIEPADIWVIHDDMDLAVGTVKTKLGGGSAGHNGIKSIDAHIGANYNRIRIGVSHPRSLGLQIDPADYVLGRFLPSEMAEIGGAIDKAAVLLGLEK